MTLVNAAPPIIELSGYDVSFGDVLHFLVTGGITGIATIVCKGALLGNVALPKPKENAA